MAGEAGASLLQRLAARIAGAMEAPPVTWRHALPLCQDGTG
jgi:hypothetical protein